MPKKSLLASYLVVILSLSGPVRADASVIIGPFAATSRDRMIFLPNEADGHKPYPPIRRILSTSMIKLTMGSIQRGKDVDTARSQVMTALDLTRNGLRAVADFKDIVITGSRKGTYDAQQ